MWTSESQNHFLYSFIWQVSFIVSWYPKIFHGYETLCFNYPVSLAIHISCNSSQVTGSERWSDFLRVMELVSSRAKTKAERAQLCGPTLSSTLLDIFQSTQGVWYFCMCLHISVPHTHIWVCVWWASCIGLEMAAHEKTVSAVEQVYKHFSTKKPWTSQSVTLGWKNPNEGLICIPETES